MAKKTTLGDDAAIYQKRAPEKERVKLKGLSFKKKLEYLKDYYLKAVIAGGVTLSVIIYMIVMLVIPKDEVVLRLVAINDTYSEEDSNALIEGFGKTINYNPDKEDISIEDGVIIDPERPNSNVQDKITVYTVAGTLDVIIADEDMFTIYAKNGFFCDLSEVLSTEEFKTLSKDLFYEKMNVVDDDNEASDTTSTKNPNASKAYGVCLDDSSIYTNMSTWYKNQSQNGASVSYYIGILNTSSQKENAVAFINYLKGL